MEIKKWAAITSLAIMASGCVATGTVHEKRVIQPDQKIDVVWTVGEFIQEPHIMSVMLNDMTDGKVYEECTNALFERTFAANGYKASAIKFSPLLRRRSDALYTLVLQNTSAQYPRVGSGSTTMAASPLVRLNMEMVLYERQTGKKLWSGKDSLASNAKMNGYPITRIVKALAADGFLSISPENVANYKGQRSGAEDSSELGCP